MPGSSIKAGRRSSAAGNHRTRRNHHWGLTRASLWLLDGAVGAVAGTANMLGQCVDEARGQVPDLGPEAPQDASAEAAP